jgi:hypothetical protein
VAQEVFHPGIQSSTPGLDKFIKVLRHPDKFVMVSGELSSLTPTGFEALNINFVFSEEFPERPSVLAGESYLQEISTLR